MKINKTIILILLLAGSAFTSCDKDCGGTGPVVTTTRTIDNFGGVDCRISAHVNIVPDQQYSVKVTTYDNCQSRIDLYESSGILIIDSHKSIDDDDVTIDIHMPRLNYMAMDGSGHIRTLGNFQSTSMNIQLSGSGKIDFTGSADILRTNISGSGEITLSGNAGNAVMKVSGSGKVYAYSMPCINNDVTLSGSGKIQTNVSEYFRVTISGSGSVYYLGTPAISTNISGSGDLISVH